MEEQRHKLLFREMMAMSIEGKLICLRAIEEEDLVFLRDLHEDRVYVAILANKYKDLMTQIGYWEQ